MTLAFINQIGTAVPANDIHKSFVALARTMVVSERALQVFDRMVERAGISHRFSVLRAGNLAAGEVDADLFYRRGAYPGTQARMELYATQSLPLAIQAIAALDISGDLTCITHLLVASCTGASSPGLDLQLAAHLGLRADLERLVIGFMGCSAAVPALRAAQRIIASDPSARVLVLNLELSTIHLQETSAIEPLLSFLLFADGCSAAMVTARPSGVALGDFRTALIPNTEDLITWHIGDHGFRMHLSGKVPARIAQVLREERPGREGLLRGTSSDDIDLWAVHAGGRTVLDAVEVALGLDPDALRYSRKILNEFGNMSSATLMFVLQRMMHERQEGRGLAMAFGPGMVAETFRFSMVP